MRLEKRVPEEIDAWRSYFAPDGKAARVCQSFNQILNGWILDAAVIHADFNLQYKKKIDRRMRSRPLLESELPTENEEEVRVPAKRARRTKKEVKKERKKDKGDDRRRIRRKKKEKRLPPAVKLPTPKNRAEIRVTVVPPEPKKQQRKQEDVEDSDVYVPTHIASLRPASQRYFAKLTRFVRSYRDARRSLPFLLRNVAVESDPED